MADRPTVLLTNPVHPDAVALLEPEAHLVTAPDARPETLRALAAGADGIIVRAKLPDDICDHGPRLRGIVRHGVGLDFIPVAAATAAGIPVANLPGSNTGAVAEYCLTAILHLRRPLYAMDAALRRDGWGPARGLADSLSEIGGSTLGVVGVGTIGRRVARMARDGFGMTVLGASRTPGRMPEGVEEAAIDDLFARSDAVVLSCPLTDETRGLVGERLLGLMKPGAVIVNVSRGPVIDTAALVRALKGGRLGGAALDVYDVQPLPPEDALLDCPNVLLTPHAAGITATSMRNMSLGAAGEMLRMLRGDTPVNLVNPEYRKA
ncbi:hydroxyacid dehydrogenase [Azospirillum halopraeferens]|uniref:hydroxyacid dehydrogenase n=1 Tax=Azospirillum halopraeferens TaxID=34010 RepID=UPI0004253CB2|nr:hydroxyacid dehydrogenase [Azospirillum halopraeferens]